MSYPWVPYLLDFWLRIHFLRNDFHLGDRRDVHSADRTRHRALGFLDRRQPYLRDRFARPFGERFHNCAEEGTRKANRTSIHHDSGKLGRERDNPTLIA